MLHLIDPIYHNLYNSLKSYDNVPNTDPDIIGEDVDITDELFNQKN